MNTSAENKQTIDWPAENLAILQLELKRLRLLLQRRVLWMQSQWQHDPLKEFQNMVISEAQINRLFSEGRSDAEQRFYAENENAVRLGEEIGRLQNKITTKRQHLREANQPAAFDLLADVLALNSFERHFVLLCLAPEMEPDFLRIYAYVQDDLTRKFPTVDLASSLFSAGNADTPLQDSLLPDSPLRRYQILEFAAEDSSPLPLRLRPLKLPGRIFQYLLGVNSPDEDTRPYFRIKPDQPELPFQTEQINRLQAHLQDILKQQISWPVVNLVGQPASGPYSFAEALCRRLGLQLLTLLPEKFPDSYRERQILYRKLEREAILLSGVFFIDGASLQHKSESRPVLDEILENTGVLKIVSSAERLKTGQWCIGVDVQEPDLTSKRQVWTDFSGQNGGVFPEQIEQVVQHFNFGPEEIPAILKLAGDNRLMKKTNGKASAADLWEACREYASTKMDDLARKISPCYTWEDIVLPPDILQQLREIAAQAHSRYQVYESWGFGEKLSRGKGISALFTGPSGTGKTMAAEILANELHLDLYRIDLSGVVSKYIGETEKNLRRVFDAADQSGAILFFDEADALFGKRTEVKDSHDRYANIEVNYLLQRMEDYRGLAILATNRRSALDRAFLRRLRFLVEFPFPDAKHRLQIWRKAFPAQSPVNGVDYDFLARLEITGGNIKNIALNAAFLAASSSRKIEMENIMHAARREYQKIDKLMNESEFGKYFG